MRVLRVALARREVVLQLRNVHAVNAVVESFRRSNAGSMPTLKRRDFLTRVRLLGLTEFRVTARESGGPAYYHHAEIGRKGGKLSLRIRFLCGSGWGTLWSVFESAGIEDIAPRLGRYFGPGVGINDMTSIVGGDPAALLECLFNGAP